MPKISIVNFSLCRGGAERISLYIADYFVLQGWSVELVIFSQPVSWNLKPSVVIVDIGTPASPFDAIRRLSSYYLDSNPDAAIVNCWPLHFYAIIARFFSGHHIRIFPVEHYSLHGSFRSFGLFKGLLFIVTLLCSYLFSDRGVAISTTMYNSLRRIGVPATKLDLIPNPVANAVQSLPYVSSFSSPLPAPCVRILMAGTLCARKDYQLALEVFSILSSNYSLNFHVNVAGDGPLKPLLESLARSLKLVDNISFLGCVDDMASAYQSTDVFFLTSRNEGLPSVLIEALSYGVTVVSVDCPDGPREILGDSYPYLVPSRDPSLLAHTLYEACLVPIPSNKCREIAQYYDVSERAADYFRLVSRHIYS